MKGQKQKLNDISNFRGETIYADIYANTLIRQGYLREVEITQYKDKQRITINLCCKTAVENTVKELQRILKNWV
jgi:ribosomal protein S8